MSALQRGQSNFGLIIQHLLLPAFFLVRPTQNLTGVTISVTQYTVAFHDGIPGISGLGVTCLALVLWNLCQLLNPLDGDTLTGGVEALIKSRETVKFAR